MSNLKDDAEKGREELASIFEKLARGVYLEDPSPIFPDDCECRVDRIMAILRAHRGLAGETFRTSLHENFGVYSDPSKQPYQEHFPAALLLGTKKGGSDLPVFQEALSFYPNAISETKGFFDETLLHVACNLDNSIFVSLPVLEYIARKSPAAMCTRNSKLELPVGYVVKGLTRTYLRDQELPKLRMLLRLSPESLLLPRPPRKHWLHDNRNIFEDVFPRNGNRELLQTLSECFNPTHSTHKRLCLPHWSKMVTLEEAKLIAPIFPKLESLLFTPHQWCLEGYQYLYQRLIENKSITNLTVSIEDDFYDGFWIQKPDKTTAPRLLQELMELNVTIQKLHLIGPTRFFLDSNALQQVFVRALTGRNTTISELTLESISFGGASGFSNLQKIIAKTRLKVLILKQVGIGRSSRGTATELPIILPDRKCRLERFEYVPGFQKGVCGWIGDWTAVSALLHQLAQVTTLKTFRWDPQDSRATSPEAEKVNLAMALSLLLQKESKLMSLQFHGERLKDISPICAALNGNNHLEVLHLLSSDGDYTNDQCKELLDVLQNQKNTTLHDIQLTMAAPQSIGMVGLQHQARLNSFGRKVALDPKATLDQFVGLLSKVVEYPTKITTTTESAESGPQSQLLNTTEDKVDVLYGLLRECPSLWSSKI